MYILFIGGSSDAHPFQMDMSQLLGREVTTGAFPWPQTILKQLEEWHVIVSRDQ